MAEEGHDPLEIQFKCLTFKKEYLFKKIQKTYDLSKAVKFDSLDSIQGFMVQYSELEDTRCDFEKIILSIMEVELQINPKAQPSTSALDIFDELYFACKRVALNCKSLVQEPVVKNSNEYDHDNLARPSLPKLTLFEFDGQIENWTTFYDTFLSLVHNRKFDNIDKFHYLLSCVKGPALNMIKNLPITANNYPLVWQSLLDKYQDKRALTGRYLDKMLSFTPLSKDTIGNLTSFIETFDHSLKAIHALNVNKLDDYLFCHIALRGLDSHTKKIFEESRDQKQLPTFSELMTFVNKQIKVLEHTSATGSWTTSAPYHSYQQKAKAPVNFTVNKNNYNAPQGFKSYNPNNNNGKMSRFNQPSPKAVLTASRSDANQNKFTCLHCKQNHMIYRCEQFRKLSLNERVDRVNALQLCTNCLKDHELQNCKSDMSCGVCGLRHHYLLHRDSGAPATATVSMWATAVPPQSSRSNAHTADIASHSVSVDASGVTLTENLHTMNEVGTNYGVVLGTTRTYVTDIAGQYQDCRAVLDSGAQSSFITLDSAQRLGLRRKKCPFTIAGLGGEIVKNFGMVTCDLKPRRSDVPKLSVDMVVVAKVSSEMPNISFPPNVVDEYKEFDLADPLFYERSSVDILLGNDIVSELTKDKPISVNSSLPNVIETIFGYVVSGKLYYENNSTSQNLHLSVCEEKSLDKVLRDFWEVEELPCKPILSPLDELAEEIYTKEQTRDANGRYVVPLLFAPAAPPLGDSRAAAERRLLATERRLARTPVLQQAYDDFMSEYEKLDHMELYTGRDPSKYLIPHHAVLRPSSTTTPLRVVFDASSRTTNNVSLNDIQLTGANLYRDISAIIVNFRLFQYCFASDICKMFRAILIKESDRKYQHILYRTTTDEPMKIYELKTVTYGVRSSPYLAIRTLLQLARDEGERFPSAAQVLREGIYMDDVLWSCETFSQACTLQDELIELLNCGGFILKKWASNDDALLTRLPVEHRESTVAFNKDRDDDVSLKLLGLHWSPCFDVFSFFVNKRDVITTKRSVLKILASIYDPTGFISPCTFVAKCILQDLWKLGIGWDEKLPLDVCKQWLEFISELPLLSELKIERHALLSGIDECELVGFCDGSSRGYASCIYAVSRCGGHVKVRLLLAKTKVNPVKPMTIPRVELLGAVLLSQQMKYLCDIMTRVKITRITALTDSSIVLAWIQTAAYKLKTFVCNRVTQIVDSIPPESWRHVNSENNMADICSRGASPALLLRLQTQWLEGPEWLRNKREDWPVSTLFYKGESDIPELKSDSKTFGLISEKTDVSENKTEFFERIIQQFSSFSKLQRTIARILKLFRRFRKDSAPAENNEVLTTNDLNLAHDCLIKTVQDTYFFREITELKKGVKFIPSLRKLSPFLDERGFLRVGGRLSYADLPYNTKHPLLLPKKNKFTQLLIEYYHKKYLHTGPQTLQNILNQKYWILSARSAIRSVHGRCRSCYKCSPPMLQPKMANLPPTRLLPNKVFEHVGVDLGGPFYIKESLRRNAKVDKAYLALFVCFSTKAVHLEVLSSLSADCFLATLDRFVARRGLCACLYSDRGTNFVAASKHLNDVQRFLSTNNKEILDGCAQRQIDWKFNPGSAASMGGLWESGIKSAKYHLVRAVGDKSLTFEELSTVFCKIEAIMNSRPLCALPASDNPNEFNVLTAGHFLIGKSLTAVPEYDLKDVPITHLSRWQYLQNCSQLFWKRWSQDYLNTLQQRSKWFTSPPNVKVGDLVLIKNDQTHSCNWPLARIEQVHPGLDGIVRKVTLRSKNSILQRPVNKLSLLPFANDVSETDSI